MSKKESSRKDPEPLWMAVGRARAKKRGERAERSDPHTGSRVRYGAFQPRNGRFWVVWLTTFGFLAAITLFCYLREISSLAGLTSRVEESWVDAAHQAKHETTGDKIVFDNPAPPAISPAEHYPPSSNAPNFRDKGLLFQQLLDQGVSRPDVEATIKTLGWVNFFSPSKEQAISLFITDRPLSIRFELGDRTKPGPERTTLAVAKISVRDQTFWIPQVVNRPTPKVSYTWTLLPADLDLEALPQSVWPQFVSRKLRDTLVRARQHYQPDKTDHLIVLLREAVAEPDPLGVPRGKETTIVYLSYVGTTEDAEEEESLVQKPRRFSLWRLRTGNFDDFVTESGIRIQPFSFQRPLARMQVSSPFGFRLHPILNVRRPHHGVDLSAPKGTPIRASADGFVTHMSNWGGYGKHMVIRHANQYETLYGHMNSFARHLQVRSFVQQGEVIGCVGSTGVSTAPHLHYEVRHSGRAVDPLAVRIKDRQQKIPDGFIHLFKQEREKIQLALGEVERMMRE